MDNPQYHLVVADVMTLGTGIVTFKDDLIIKDGGRIYWFSDLSLTVQFTIASRYNIYTFSR